MTLGSALDPAGLLVVGAICHGFALFVAVSVGVDIHVNPAVTFGFALGGQIDNNPYGDLLLDRPTSRGVTGTGLLRFCTTSYPGSHDLRLPL